MNRSRSRPITSRVQSERNVQTTSVFFRCCHNFESVASRNRKWKVVLKTNEEPVIIFFCTHFFNVNTTPICSHTPSAEAANSKSQRKGFWCKDCKIKVKWRVDLWEKASSEMYLGSRSRRTSFSSRFGYRKIVIRRCSAPSTRSLWQWWPMRQAEALSSYFRTTRYEWLWVNA